MYTLYNIGIELNLNSYEINKNNNLVIKKKPLNSIYKIKININIFYAAGFFFFIKTYEYTIYT